MTIPVDFIPDDQFAKARDAALYSIAPGTKTLEAQALDVQVKKNEQDALQEALRLKETARQADMDNSYKTASLGETVRANNMDNSYKTNALQASLAAAQQKAANGADAAAVKNSKNESAAYKDHALFVMQNNYAKAKKDGRAEYNFASYIDYMKAKGAWDLMTEADKTAVMKAAQTLSGSL